MRALFNGHYIIDTIEPYWVWEHPYYPQYYVPFAALKTGGAAKVEKTEAIQEKGIKVATMLKITVADRSTNEGIYFEDIEQCGKVRGLVKVTFGAMGEFHPIFQSYKKIDLC